MLLCTRLVQCWSGYISEGDRRRQCAARLMGGEANQIVSRPTTIGHVISCLDAYRTHTCTQIQRLKASRATPHQAINTVRKIPLNNPFMSPVDAFPDRLWHHVSMLLESEHPSNHTRWREQRLPDVLCAAGSPKKASSFYSCDVVVLQRCTLLLVPWNDSPSHCSTCKIPQTQHSRCAKDGETGGGSSCFLQTNHRAVTKNWKRPMHHSQSGLQRKKGPPPATFQVRVGRLFWFWWHREFILQVISFSFLKCSQPQLF